MDGPEESSPGRMTEGNNYHEAYNKNRRPSMWASTSNRLAHNLESMLTRGRRGSAAQIITRLVSGALHGGYSEPSMKTGPTNGFLENIEEGVVLPNQVVEVDPKVSRQQGNENLGLILSALYGKVLVVMGIAFPMSEVISTYIPPSYYDGFYIYLYLVSIIYMLCLVGNTYKAKAARSARDLMQRMYIFRRRTNSTDSGVSSHPDPEANSCTIERIKMNIEEDLFPESSASGKESSLSRSRDGDSKDNSTEVLNGSSRSYRFGSFYLRMGAVAFGIGSMIYSGLEFGQYLELSHDTHCHNFIITLTPLVRIIFTFMQMYFIFLHYKEAVSHVSMVYQFGLMHMIGTNLCVWLNVLVLETRHEILHFYDPNNKTISLQKYLNKGHPVPIFSTGYHKGHVDIGGTMSNFSSPVEEMASALVGAVLGNNGSFEEFDHALDVHHRMKRGLRGPHSIYECRRTNIMGNLVTDASPFLFPCTIEYSLTCAAICYVMWKSIATRRAARHGHSSRKHGESHEVTGNRSPHHYTVDCARANKGLFLGIFVLVLIIMCLILNYVLAHRPGYQALATLQVNITGIGLYTMTTLAVLIGMCQVRCLRYDGKRNLELDNILLIVAQTGSFIHNMFSIIAGQFTVTYSDKLSQMTALTCLIQTMLQTLFILDASKRSASTPYQLKWKPGREVVTFLLVCNLGMWLINSLEKSRDIVQIHFYGVWAWTIIADISMPLAIFYRFHSTVCLCEVWKKIGKLRT